MPVVVLMCLSVDVNEAHDAVLVVICLSINVTEEGPDDLS